MLIAGLLFLLLPLGSSQGYLSIKSSIDKTKITVGDPITYTLTVTREESVKVQLPELGANLGGFEIRDYSLNPGRRLKDGRIQDRVDYVIAIYETGEYEIPPVEVGYTLPNGEKGKLSSQPIKIWVESVKPSDAKDIRGIKDPVSIGFDWKPYYKWGGLILLFVGAGSYLWWRRRRGGITEEGIEYRGPPLPAHLIAFEELERIGKLGLVEKGEIKRYYTELSEVIRRYISRRYGVQTMELTTGEIVEEMIAAEVDGEVISLFQEFLEECDLVKFAKYLPPKEKISAAMGWAHNLVERTKVEEKPQEEAYAAG